MHAYAEAPSAGCNGECVPSGTCLTTFPPLRISTPGGPICDGSETIPSRLDSAAAQAPTRRRWGSQRANIHYNINPKSELLHILTQTSWHSRDVHRWDGNLERDLTWFSLSQLLVFPPRRNAPHQTRGRMNESIKRMTFRYLPDVIPT